MTEDSASVADKIKKKLHIQSKSGLEKFQVSLLLIIVLARSHSYIHLLSRNGVPKTSTLLVDSLGVFSLVSRPPDSC